MNLEKEMIITPALANKTSVIADKYINRTLATAKRRVVPADVEKTITTILKNINLFNGLYEDESILNGVSIDEIDIPEEFKDIILPNSVRYDTAYRAMSDILKRNTRSTLKFNINEWKDNCDAFRSYFKMDATTSIVKLSDLRVNKSLADVFNQFVTEDGHVHYADTPYIPIALDDITAICGKKNRWFNYDVNDMINEYFSNWYVK